MFLDSKGEPRHSLFTTLVRLKADPRDLGEVFVWFTTKGYTVREEDLLKTPIPDIIRAGRIGYIIKNGDFEEIYKVLPSNVYKNDPGKKRFNAHEFNPEIRVFTHPVIFDYFLNCHFYEFIQKFSNIEDLREMAWYRYDLLEMLIDCYPKLDPTDKVKLDLEKKFREVKEFFSVGSVHNGNVILSKIL